ncbi:MAG: DUF1810 family protein [Eubacteriales bacterium]|nr:DUF1810 family protein [Eubacteriales bacterium]
MRQNQRCESTGDVKLLVETECEVIILDNNLERYLIAQQTHYRTALDEFRSGQKRSHWMWFIFPQIAGLGYSETARYYLCNRQLRTFQTGLAA